MKDHNIIQIISKISRKIILLKKEIISLKKDKNNLIKCVNKLENKLNNFTKINNTNNKRDNTYSNEKNKIKIVLNSNKVNKQTLEEIIFELKKIDENGNFFTITKLESIEDNKNDSEANENKDFFYNFYLGDTLINATDKLFTYEDYK
jgi:predicted RNase H-like nuclease (RuvC/YqgF family)